MTANESEPAVLLLDHEQGDVSNLVREPAVLFVDHQEGYIGNTADYLSSKLTAAPVDRLCEGSLSSLLPRVKKKIEEFEKEYEEAGQPIIVKWLIIDLVQHDKTDGFKLLKDIKADPYTKHRDVYIFTVKSISLREKLDLIAAGACDVFILGGTTKVWEAAEYIQRKLGLPPK